MITRENKLPVEIKREVRGERNLSGADWIEEAERFFIEINK